MSNRTSSGSTATSMPTKQTQPMPAPMGQTQQGGGLQHDKIAMRAYQKWLQRGCPCGTDRQDWLEAEAELRAEISRGGMASTQPQQRR